MTKLNYVNLFLILLTSRLKGKGRLESIYENMILKVQ